MYYYQINNTHLLILFVERASHCQFCHAMPSAYNSQNDFLRDKSALSSALVMIVFLPAAYAAAGLHLTFRVTVTDRLNAKEALCFKKERQTYNNQMMGLSNEP